MSEWPQSIGVVGCGAMGGAMALGFSRDATSAGRRIVVTDAVEEVAERCAAMTGATVGTQADAAACDLLVLAVKPKDAEIALRDMAPALGHQTVIMSVVAGWSIDRIAELAPSAGIARTMPNLAVRHGAGLIAIASRGVSDDHLTRLERVLRSLGAVVHLPENLIGPATALVGSGPGFVALVAEGLEDGAVAVGFSRDQARTMVHAVLAGSASLLADGTDPAELRQRVSSPAGTTIEGLGVLERGGVRAHLADAVRAAARRASEL